MKVEKPQVSWKLPLSRPVKGVAGKTGLWRTIKPVLDVTKCTKCYQCEIFCPGSCIRVEVDTGPLIDYDYCKGCGVCADVCPVGAIYMVSEHESA